MDMTIYNLKIFIMKYIKILIIIALTSNSIYAQSYEDLKKLDTIYIPFKQGKYNIKIDYPEEKNGFKNRGYFFNYKKKDASTFRFEFDRNNILENKEISKSFLQKKKRKIIPIGTLKKIDYQDIACDVFNQLKIIYVVDFSQRKNKSIMLYRVISMNYCPSIE